MNRFVELSARGVLLVLLWALSPVSVADPLEQMVGAEQAQAMGLDKLSDAERAELARWIERHTDSRPAQVTSPTAVAEPVPALRAPVAIGTAAAFGLDQSAVDGEQQELRARLVGRFTGWDGKTQFKLDNGQVWRQSSSGVYRHEATDPEVVIERSLLGYKLRLVETKRSITVRRVK